MASQMSTTISGQRRIHVVQAVLDTCGSSGLMSELVLRVTGMFTCLCHVLQGMTAGKCAFGSTSEVYAQ
jgi:hypothetical protein